MSLNPREKGTLPRAYLRIDPNLDHTHEAPIEMLKLILAANRQMRRGRFKNRTALANALGAAMAKRVIGRGDVVEHLAPEDCEKAPEHVRLCAPGAHLYVEGWDEWQESDLEVGARMRRLRDRQRRNAVTPDEGIDKGEPDRNAVTPEAIPSFTQIVTTGVRRQASLVPKSVSSTYLEPANGGAAAKAAGTRERRATGLRPISGSIASVVGALGSAS
jgi:hypothetical protein